MDDFVIAAEQFGEVLLKFPDIAGTRVTQNARGVRKGEEFFVAVLVVETLLISLLHVEMQGADSVLVQVFLAEIDSAFGR